jgi:hypothetical protein
MIVMLFLAGYDEKGRSAVTASTLWGERELVAYGPNACAQLAAELVARGVEDQSWQAIDTEGERLFGADSLYRLAEAAAPSSKPRAA